MSLKQHQERDWQIYTYDAATKRKVYLGVRPTQREAKQLEREHMLHRDTAPTSAGLTVREYAQTVAGHPARPRHPPPLTAAPARSTRANSACSSPSTATGPSTSFKRREALDWARLHQTRAKSVSAMFNDAVDDELVTANPFANRRHPRERGAGATSTRSPRPRSTRSPGSPWTGGARTGTGKCSGRRSCSARGSAPAPGKRSAPRWQDLDLRDGLVTVKRVKPPYNTDTCRTPFDRRGRHPDVCPVSLTRPLLFPGIRGERVDEAADSGTCGTRSGPRSSHVTPERWPSCARARRNLDFYALRHYCAS